MAASKVKNAAQQGNFDVDYVIVYRFADTEQKSAVAQFEKLIHALSAVGLGTEVRAGDHCSVLIFLKLASERHLNAEVYRSRVKDWLHGLRQAAPEKETQQSLSSEPLTDAERLRIVHSLITSQTYEGGANITAKQGEWKNVESIFALHDYAFNKDWIKTWSQSWFLNISDLTAIRDKFGEKIAFYFAFLQSYFAFLLFPSIFGFSAYVLLGYYSPIYAIVNCLWCIVFVEYWKHQETDLAVRWGVRGVSKIQMRRPQFKYEKEVKDPVTGEMVKVFSEPKRLVRQLLQVPFALVTAILLGTLIAGCFGIEIFISEVYDGPGKGLLVFLPTGLLTILVPVISTLLTDFATRLTEYENYETSDSYEAAMTQKIFLLNFITSYLGIILTAFVYEPFGRLIVPYLDIFNVTVKPFANDEKELKVAEDGFQINPDRLRKQVIYFAVTAQIVGLALEVIVPYVKRKGFRKFNQMKSKRAVEKGGAPDVAMNDSPEEATFLARVRNEAELDVYDVNTDLREMVMQFGYLSLFSVVWPLTACSFLVNNWLELRSDAIKITVEMQRPTPWRADTIGPWLDSLGFLTWLGSITSAALVFLFSNGHGPGGSPVGIKGWGLLLTIFFSEHIYMVVRLAVRTALSKLESPGLQKERAEKFLVRKRYFEESVESLESRAAPNVSRMGEKVDRAALEDQARHGSLHGSTPESRFWDQQGGWEDTIKVGSSIIAQAAPSEGKKVQ